VISVIDGLPKEGETVLIKVKGIEYPFPALFNGDWTARTGHLRLYDEDGLASIHDGFNYDDVTHWERLK